MEGWFHIVLAKNQKSIRLANLFCAHLTAVHISFSRMSVLKTIEMLFGMLYR